MREFERWTIRGRTKMREERGEKRSSKLELRRRENGESGERDWQRQTGTRQEGSFLVGRLPGLQSGFQTSAAQLRREKAEKERFTPRYFENKGEVHIRGPLPYIRVSKLFKYIKSRW